MFVLAASRMARRRQTGLLRNARIVRADARPIPFLEIARRQIKNFARPRTSPSAEAELWNQQQCRAFFVVAGEVIKIFFLHEDVGRIRFFVPRVAENNHGALTVAINLARRSAKMLLGSRSNEDAAQERQMRTSMPDKTLTRFTGLEKQTLILQQPSHFNELLKDN